MSGFSERFQVVDCELGLVSHESDFQAAVRAAHAHIRQRIKEEGLDAFSIMRPVVEIFDRFAKRRAPQTWGVFISGPIKLIGRKGGEVT